MSESAEIPGWYAEARRRAVASGRRRGAVEASAASVEWPEFAPPVALAGGPLGAVQAADREIARQTARRARAVAEFAASRPASVDRAQGERGAMSPERWGARSEALREVSEWAAPELSVALSIGQRSAETLLERSLLLVHRLPGVLAALEAGALHPGHLFPLLEKVAPIADDAVRAEVEAALLRWAAGRVTTPAQLGDKARRELLRRDVRAAGRRLAKALAERGVSMRPASVEGMAELLVSGTVPEVHALCAALGQYADALPADGRTRGQKMLDCLLDLVLRPGESGLPPVQVLLTMVAPVGTLAGGDQPGEIDGQPVPAELIRALLAALGPTPAPTDDGRSAPADAPADAPAVCWQQEEQELLARWSDELAERILTGEFDDLPAGSYDDQQGALDPERWPLAADRLDALDQPVPDQPVPDEPVEVPDEQPPRPSRPAESQQSPASEVLSGGPHATGPHGTGSHATGPQEAGPQEVGRGDDEPGDRGRVGRWWADADRAVIDAGVALRDAEQALGHARRLVAVARRAEAADEAAWQASPAGRVSAADDALTQLAAATDAHRGWLAALLDDTGGGGLAERPRIALTDALTGALLGLTDLRALRRSAHCGRPACRRRPQTCTHDLTGRPGLGPPAPTDGYRPGAELDRFVRARDRRCRFPGCRRRVPSGGELDHNRRYPDGPTDATNLTGYCTADHRGKHQAPGWLHDLAPDGTLTVTTPTGLVAVTTPPPY